MHRLAAPAALLAAGLALLGTGCGSSSTHVAARAGKVEIIDPFVPAPASPSVGAFYLTLRNTGSSPDELVGASSAVATSTTMHAETKDGDMEMMTPLSDIELPPGRTVTLAPGGDHVMLDGLRRSVRQGQTVTVTLHFAHAGTVSVAAPVTSLTAAVSKDMSSMGGM